MSRSRNQQWTTVARREVSVKLHDKTFIGSTIFMLVLILGFMIVPGLLSSGASKVAVVDRAGAQVVRVAEQQGSEIEPVTVANAQAAEDQVSSGDADAALLPHGRGFEMVGDRSIDSDVSGALSTAVSSWAMERNAGTAGLSPQELYQGAAVETRMLQPSDLSEGQLFGLKFGFAMVFYITALGFGMVLSQSVVQEKESRVVEILRATMPARALLLGKIAGNTVLAFLQLGVIVLAGVIGALVGGQGDLLAGMAPATAWFVPFFVLGFVALAGIFAVAGSMATRQEDLQSTTMPAQAVLGIPLMLMLNGSDSMLTLLSYVPVASSFAMPARIAAGQVAWWGPLVSVAVVAVFTYVLVRFAARAYDATLLQTQGASTWRGLLSRRAVTARS